MPGFSWCLGAEWGTERSPWEWNVDQVTKTERLSLTALGHACPGLWNPGWGFVEEGPGRLRKIRPASGGLGLLRGSLGLQGTRLAGGPEFGAGSQGPRAGVVSWVGD